MEEQKEKRVLAMYDVRGKQEFIFRSPHIKEIVGASRIIRDIYKEYLVRALKNLNYKVINLNFQKTDSFSSDNFEKQIADNENTVGEVIYDGGGNFLVLYKNKDICKKINEKFTRIVLEEIGTLKVLCTYIEIDDYSDFKKNREELYKKHRITEAKNAPVLPGQIMPFTKIDLKTSLPMTDMFMNETVSHESFVKYQKYKNDKDSETDLDKMVTEKGTESLLAVIYIDGNNMGAQVENCLNDVTYDKAVNKLRVMSKEIQKYYVDDRRNDIEKALNKIYGEGNGKKRFVVYAGDEINFICNARVALELVKVYMKGLKSVNKGSACAGICIFHSHAPYSEAYRIAEECCENAKKVMKDKNLKNAFLIDWQFCPSGFAADLEAMRKEGNGSKPWSFGEMEDITSLNLVEEMKTELNKLSRSNVKGLSSYINEGETKYLMELERINAHAKDKSKIVNLNLENNKLTDIKKQMALVYDMVTVYDYWFRSQGE